MEHQQPDDILHDIESTRAALGEKLDQLDARVHQAVDPRHYVARRPWELLGGAVALGFLLGLWRRAPAAPEYLPDMVDRRLRPNRARDLLKLVALATLISFVRDYVRMRLSGRAPAPGTDTEWGAGDGI